MGSLAWSNGIQMKSNGRGINKINNREVSRAETSTPKLCEGPAEATVQFPLVLGSARPHYLDLMAIGRAKRWQFRFHFGTICCPSRCHRTGETALLTRDKEGAYTSWTLPDEKAKHLWCWCASFQHTNCDSSNPPVWVDASLDEEAILVRFGRNSFAK